MISDIVKNTIERTVRHKKYGLIVIALIILFSGMRVVFINADAPQDLSISAAIFTDEGFKTFAARNFLLFGDWKWTDSDEYESWLDQSPLGTFTSLAVFHCFGVGFAPIRFLSVAYSIATMVLLFIFAGRFFDRKTALLSLILFGFNYFIIMSGRLAFFEVHLNFYVMATLLCVAEAVRRFHEKKFLPSLIFWALAGAGITAQFFLKKNFLIIIIAVLPAFVLSYLKYRDVSERTMKTALAVMIALSGVSYLLFAHMGSFQESLARLINVTVMGRPLVHFLPLRTFDPIAPFLGKGIYLEFIFLQPISFAVGIFFAIYVLYKFCKKMPVHGMDIFLSSWLLFGFILLTLMSYHPSRYYTLFIIPMTLLLSRAFSELDTDVAANFFSGKKEFPFNVMVSLLYLTLTVYSGVVLLVQLVPFSVRSGLMRILYPAFSNGNIPSVFYIVIPLAVIEFVLVFAIIIFRKRLKHNLLKKGAVHVLFLAIVSLQAIQYGKWFIFHDSTLYNTSKALGTELPENSVLIGSWSSGLSMENRLRPLIIQAANTYNYGVVEKLMRGEKISTVLLHKGGREYSQESGMPMYFAVSRNVVFERPIIRRFDAILHPGNIVKKFTLGYFDVEIYKLEPLRK